MRGVVVPIFLARACTGGYLENGNTCKTRPFTTKLVLSALSSGSRCTPSYLLTRDAAIQRSEHIMDRLFPSTTLKTLSIFAPCHIPIHATPPSTPLSRPKPYLLSAVRLIPRICHDDSRHSIFVMRVPRQRSLALTLNNASHPLSATHASISNASLRVKADKLRLRKHASCITVVRFTFVCHGCTQHPLLSIDDTQDPH
jgi:hypothetical protein